MPVVMALTGVAVLLGAGLLAVALQRLPGISRLVYFVCFVACLAILGVACGELLAGTVPAPTLLLPVGLPWVGAHFRVDALSAFFLAVVNLGGAGASLYAIGYGQHEAAPGRVLPFYPAFLGAMNLVVLADDAFTFLVAWEFMSLTSWALVMAHHRDPENRRAGYIYIVMASFGTLTLLLAFGLLAGSGGGYAFAEIRAAAAGPARRRPRAGAGRRRLQGRPGAAARVAAARPPGGAEPRLRPHERGDDQGRRLRLRAHRLRSAGPAGLVVEHRRARRRQHHGACSAC